MKEFLSRCHEKNLSLVLCRPTRIVRRKYSEIQRRIKPGFLKIIPESELIVYYLNRSQYRNAVKLLSTIIELERLSYIVEFSQKFNYRGSFQIIRNATTALLYDNYDNYDSLENLGDSVLKVVSSLMLFYAGPYDNEEILTNKRTANIKNKYLTSVALSNELFYYLRASNINPKHFRPAYYSAKFQEKETFYIKEKFSDGTLADFVEALIGAFFSSTGFLDAVNFIKQLKILPDNVWNQISHYFSNNYTSICSELDLKNFAFSNFIDLIPETTYKSMEIVNDFSILERLIGYSFKNKDILKEAFTHKSLNEKENYERLEFLGDAVMDIIVSSNMFAMGKFSADKLTVFRHMLVNNNIFSKLSLSLGLQRFFRATAETYDMISKYLKTLIWEENILDFGVYNSDPPKYLNDLFESLVGAVLVDSQSLDFTCRHFSPMLKSCMICLAVNQDRCDMNIRSKLSVFGQRKHIKIDTITKVVDCGVEAEVFVEENSVCKVIAHTSWLAKQLASDLAYSLLINK